MLVGSCRRSGFGLSWCQCRDIAHWNLTSPPPVPPTPAGALPKKSPLCSSCCPPLDTSPELVLVSGLWEPAGALSALLFLNCSLQKLIYAIYADYARSLKNLGFKQGAVLFASKAGAAGRDLLNELESPKQELTDWRVTSLCAPGHPASRAVARVLVWLWTVTAQTHECAVLSRALVSCSPCMHNTVWAFTLWEASLGPVFISEKDRNTSDIESVTFYTLETALRVPRNAFHFFKT